MKITEIIDCVPPRVLPVFYVLDTSDNMRGEYINALNKTMVETVAVLKEQASKLSNVEIRIAVLIFNSTCRWITDGLECLEYFVWRNLSAEGISAMGETLKELDTKLSRNSFLRFDTGVYLPSIIFMTAGYSTDDYIGALQQINNNKWFQLTRKVAFVLGGNADKAMMTEIVGTSEAVIENEDLDRFSELMKMVSIGVANVCAPKVMRSGKDIVREAMDILRKEIHKEQIWD